MDNWDAPKIAIRRKTDAISASSGQDVSLSCDVDAVASRLWIKMIKSRVDEMKVEDDSKRNAVSWEKPMNLTMTAFPSRLISWRQPWCDGFSPENRQVSSLGTMKPDVRITSPSHLIAVERHVGTGKMAIELPRILEGEDCVAVKGTGSCLGRRCLVGRCF